jgi:hypothetical protein
MEYLSTKLEWFDDTLALCGVDLDGPANILKEVLYEDFAVSAHTFFHPINLDPLFTAGLITADLLALCLQIREKVITLVEAQTIREDIRQNQLWANIIALCQQGQRMRQSLSDT